MLLKTAKPDHSGAEERHCLACGEQLDSKITMLICTDCLDLRCAALVGLSGRILNSTNIAESVHGRIRTQTTKHAG